MILLGIAVVFITWSIISVGDLISLKMSPVSCANSDVDSPLSIVKTSDEREVILTLKYPDRTIVVNRRELVDVLKL